MTQVIAVRRFYWVDQPDREILVSIGKPERALGDAGDFYCPIMTTGLGDDQGVQAIFGVDGFQAIELALRYIGYRLSDINEKNDGRLRWEFGDEDRLPEEWAQKES